MTFRPDIAVKIIFLKGLKPRDPLVIHLSEKMVLGSEQSVDVVIDDSEVTDRHASLRRNDNAVYIEAIRFDGIVKVNGVPIAKAHPLVSGDMILLGRTEMRLVF